jgi:hypothetical protein
LYATANVESVYSAGHCVVEGSTPARLAKIITAKVAPGLAVGTMPDFHQRSPGLLYTINQVGIESVSVLEQLQLVVGVQTVGQS